MFYRAGPDDDHNDHQSLVEFDWDFPFLLTLLPCTTTVNQKATGNPIAIRRGSSTPKLLGTNAKPSMKAAVAVVSVTLPLNLVDAYREKRSNQL